jgi:hypothetical protein
MSYIRADCTYSAWFKLSSRGSVKLPQGESSRDKIYEDIFSFLILNNKPATSQEMLQHWRESALCAKATFYKYLNQLCENGRLICNPKRGAGKDEYEVSVEWSNEMRRKFEFQPRNTKLTWIELKEQIKELQAENEETRRFRKLLMAELKRKGLAR